MENPLVSIIIPTYNGALRIQKAIDSVLAQSYKNIEIIVVDDGSTDKTADILTELQKKEKRIIILKNEQNQGFAKSLSIGVKKARGKYIARLDDDDFWVSPEKLRKQIAFMEKNTEYVLTGGGIIVCGSDGKETVRYLFPEQDEEIRKGLLVDNLFAHSCVVFSKDACLKSGGYNQKFGFFSDIDLWLKMGELGKFYNFQEYFSVYLDKEDEASSYSGRDDGIRKKLFLRLSMKRQYQKVYPGFAKAVFLVFAGYVYSFLPLRRFIKPFFFQIRIRLFKTPYKYYKNNRND